MLDDDEDYDPTAMQYSKQDQHGYPHSPWSALLITSVHAETPTLWSTLREAGIDVQASNGTDTDDGIPDREFPHLLVSAQDLRAVLDAYLEPKRRKAHRATVKRAGGLPKYYRSVAVGLIKPKREPPHPDFSDILEEEDDDAFLEECAR